MDPPGWFPLIVHGGGGVNPTYEDDGTVTVQFRKARHAAGKPTEYGNMPTGTAAWVDRPVNDAEPSVLRQQMNDDAAADLIQVLREGGWWKFVCRNTNAGYFEVLRSERTSAEYNL
jgi:hypothetical protein